ncbi:MAG: FG-GAP repeat protein [Deltaproteobacteria bacterium]|nr:FG-GAP repeat protein [Deltaproteobacteria bacterium]
MNTRPAKRILYIICAFFILTAPLSAHAKPKAPVITFPPHSRTVPVKVPFKKPCYSKRDQWGRLGGPFGRTALRYNDCDEDGFDSTRDGGGDCNDYDARVHPGVTETCDTRDNNCDGEVDEGVTNACGTCGAVPAEVCDGVDNNCNGATDEGVTNACGTCGDVPVEVCDGVDNNCNGVTDEGVTNACGTCGDVPAEVCDGVDNNCNGVTDEGVTNACGTCGAVPVEVCDGVDNDCNGTADDGLADRPTANQQGACSGDMVTCGGTLGWHPKPTNHVKTAEVCDGIDNDCANGIDNGLTTRPAGNTQGLCSGNTEFCDGTNGYQPSPANYTPTAEVCDTRDNNCNGATDEGVTNACGTCGDVPVEVCDGLDNNCADGVDEGLPLYRWYADADSDNYGDAEVYVSNCYSSHPSHVANPDDCNDTDPTINPGVLEDLTRIGDENCDGQGIGNLSAADAVFEGDTASDYTGFSMANVGDMDGDSVPDILVGAPSLRSLEPFGTGEAVLLTGHPENFLDMGAEIYHKGVNLGDSAGVTVASAGDMNDDGVPDVIIGATTVDNGGLDAGAAYLIYGPYISDVSLSSADFVINGIAQYDDVGYMLHSAGDFNCDGYDDLLIGAAYNNNGGTNAGEVYVIYGPLTTGSMSLSSADVTIRATEAWSLFGNSGVAADLDVDGCSDLVLGAPMAGTTDKGKVYIFKGSESPASLMTTASADAVFTGGTDGEWAGSGLAIKENADLTGDGNVDLVIGSQYNNCNDTHSGAVYIVSDPLTSRTLSTSESAFICGDGSFDQLGDYSSSLDIGDLDGDGVYDLVIGNESRGDSEGMTFLFFGPINGTKNASDADQILNGESDGYYAGRSAIFIDDMNSDGILEIGIGDPATGATCSGCGSAYIINGKTLIP